MTFEEKNTKKGDKKIYFKEMKGDKKSNKLQL